jgi:hypothetical protein
MLKSVVIIITRKYKITGNLQNTINWMPSDWHHPTKLRINKGFGN